MFCLHQFCFFYARKEIFWNTFHLKTEFQWKHFFFHLDGNCRLITQSNAVQLVTHFFWGKSHFIENKCLRLIHCRWCFTRCQPWDRKKVHLKMYAWTIRAIRARRSVTSYAPTQYGGWPCVACLPRTGVASTWPSVTRRARFAIFNFSLTASLVILLLNF